MDNSQPATNKTIERKRENSQVNPVQAHSMETRRKAQEQAMSKLRKQETDPLKIEHILEKVFSFLDTSSIKTARQVNSLWSIEGAKSLITKYYVKIPTEIQAGDSSTRNTTMEKFKHFLSHKSKDFPVIPNIIVATIGDVGHWKSLGVLGQKVKSLKFKFMDSQAKLLHNLLNLLPNLKYLSIQDTEFPQYRTHIIRIIVNVMSKKERDGRPLVASSITLNSKYEEGLADMEKLADCKNVMIEELGSYSYFLRVANSEARIVNVLSKLLSTSRNVLKKLTLTNCKYYLPFLEFSCMTELTKMHLDLNFWPEHSAQLHSCKFAPSFRFSENVPNLQEINLGGSSDLPDFLQILLDNTGTAPSVKRVNCFGSYVDCEVDQLFKTFPNTEDFRGCVNANSESKFRSLWTLGKNLKKLRLFINWRPDMGNFPNLDFLFTGFDAETVNKIKETPNLDLFTLEELEKLRVNPGISNLKELEDFSLDLCGKNPKTVPNRMLTVAAKYEINQLPKKTWIYITASNTSGFRRAFEEVSEAPYFDVWFE